LKAVIRGSGALTTYWIDGAEVTKERFDQLCPDVKEEPSEHAGSCFVAWKPLASDALAVHPKQVKQAALDAEAKGVPTRFLPDGRPVFESRSQRKRYCEAYGYFDRDGGYGDAQPGGSHPHRAGRREGP
jgi:hypothetical protein